MPLKGIKPKKIEKRLKALFYGAAGVGKTTAAIQFPAPYIIDTEKGSENDQYIDLLEKQGGAIYQTSDFDEMIEDIISLTREEHPYKTLIIDPLTVVYNDLLDKMGAKHGTDFGRHYGHANKMMKRMMNLLIRLDMNVIITSHAKNEYGDKLQVLGQTFDCYKKLDYLFDLVIQIEKKGRDRFAKIHKSRLHNFPEGEIIPFSYDEVAERYGRDVLERDAAPIELASDDQVNSIVSLIEILKVDDDVVAKWLKKAGAETFNEMSSHDIVKCIDFLKSKINDA